MTGQKLTDANDLEATAGPEAVKSIIDNAVMPDAIAAEPNPPRKAKRGDAKGPPNDDGVSGFDPDGRPVIRHKAGQRPAVLDAIGKVFAAESDINLMVHAGRLTRLYVVDTSTGWVQRQQGALIMKEADSHLVAELATSKAIHHKWDNRAGDYKVIDCPRGTAEGYISRGHWPELPHLSGFVEAPLITSGGEVIDQLGLHAPTGIYVAATVPGYAPPPAKPSMKDAEIAMDRLLESVETFPFVDWADRAAALAGYITALIARVLTAKPWFVVDATCPGTGKTLLVDGFAMLATGRTASVLSLGHDDAETEKRLGGVLLSGDACINVDNVERGLGGDIPCQVASQGILRIRALGTSSMTSVPTNTFLAATGNQIQIRGDLKRRVCMIRLDAHDERPERRKFSRNHLEYVAANRGELIRAALTIPLAYLAAGTPDVQIHPMGGFEVWDRLVRRPLVWLGFPDPLASSESLRDADPELEAMRQFMIECSLIYKDEPFTAADVVADAMETEREVNGKSTGIAVRPALRDAVRVVCRDKASSSALGYWLRAHRDRIVDGMRIEHAGEHGRSKVSRWKVVTSISSK